MIAVHDKLFSVTPPAKRLIGSDKVSKFKTYVSSDQRNFVKCPNSSTNSYLLNTKTGATLAIGCNRWDCPVCGEKKIWRLKKAIYNVTKKWNRIRMMTLTVSSNYSDSKENHYKFLQECWRRYITELRRTKSLRADQRNFQFIRVPEEHKSGYMHMHCIIDTFLDIKVCYTVWQHIIHETSKDPFLTGSVVLSSLPGAADASRYLTKYITKLLACESYITRRYSKSGEIVLFSRKNKTGVWQFCFGIRPTTEDENFDSLMSFFTSQNIGTTSQENQSVDDSDPPNKIDFERKRLEETIQNTPWEYPEACKSPWNYFKDSPYAIPVRRK